MISRLKELRKALSLTQEEFGKRINLKQNSIALIETEKRNPSDRTLYDICSEFNVNETWLRSGEGDMFYVLTEEEELISLVSRICSNKDELKKIVLQSAARFIDDDVCWNIVLEQIKKIKLNDTKKE